MSARARENLFPAGVALVAVFVIGWLTLYGWAWTDYDDEARPAFDALINGHVAAFLQLAPAYGGSLLIRAPFVLATQLWGGGELAIFRAAAAPCLAASAILGVWLVAHMRHLRRSAIARGLAMFLCVANPITLPALEFGHPEELLGAVLSVGAVLVAMRGRPIWAGVLLGLAVANKEWAILATGPVLIALPDRRWRALLSATAVAGLIVAPFLLAGSAGLLSQLHAGSSARVSPIFQPWQAWWFLGAHGHVVRGLYGDIKVGYRTPPGWIETIAHPLVIAVAVPLTGLSVWLRRRALPRPAYEPLLLLALLLLVRCVLDPWDVSYYSLPFLISFLAWEVLAFARPPVLALAASFVAWFVFQATASPSIGLSADGQSAVFLAFALPATAFIAAALYTPGIVQRVAIRRAHSEPVPSAA